MDIAAAGRLSCENMGSVPARWDGGAPAEQDCAAVGGYVWDRARTCSRGGSGSSLYLCFLPSHFSSLCLNLPPTLISCWGVWALSHQGQGCPDVSLGKQRRRRRCKGIRPREPFPAVQPQGAPKGLPCSAAPSTVAAIPTSAAPFLPAAAPTSCPGPALSLPPAARAPPVTV